MGSVHLRGIDRPGLHAALIARGLAVARYSERAIGVAIFDAILAIELSNDDSAGAMAQVRASWPGPLAVLTAGVDEAAQVGALDAGADDVIPDSASDSLIAARIAALSRRLTRGSEIKVGALRIDQVERRAIRDGRLIALLPREYRLLRHLAAQPGKVASRAELLRAVWQLNFDPGTNVVEVHMSRLRARIDRGFATPLLRTVKGQGYYIVDDNMSASAPGTPDLAIAAPRMNR